MKHRSGFPLCALLLLCGLTGCSHGTQKSSIQTDSGTARTAPHTVTTAAPVQTESAESETTTAPPAPERILVTLGDSISAGYGLKAPEEQRYSALTAKALTAQDGIRWRDCNAAVSGDDSRDLIRRLKNGKAPELPDADAIVICIGANNLLGPYQDFLANISGALHISGEGLTEDLFGELSGIIQSHNEAVGRLKTNIEAGFYDLEDNLPQIYDMIRAQNADAPVYLLNVYNPYAGVELENPLDPEQSVFSYTQGYLDRLNGILADFAAAHADIVPVDIAAAFAACEKPPVQGNVNGYTPKDGKRPNPDPHPTAEGQQIIADTLLKAMRKQT